MDALMGAGTYPFAIAALVLAGLVAVELVAMLTGGSLSALLDDGLSQQGESSVLGAWMSWLNAGGVPLLVLIMIWLASFAVAGFALQALARGLAGPLPTLIACLAAFALALPPTRTLSRWVARIIPGEETSIVNLADFVGLTGTVALGPLDQGKPGQVRIRDGHGNIHVLRARAGAGHLIAQGATVLIVDRTGGVFEAIPAPVELGASHSSRPGATQS
jgi:hypothetical protein